MMEGDLEMLTGGLEITLEGLETMIEDLGMIIGDLEIEKGTSRDQGHLQGLQQTKVPHVEGVNVRIAIKSRRIAKRSRR